MLNSDGRYGFSLAGFDVHDFQTEGFHNWGYPNSWMLDTGKSQSKMDDDDLGVSPLMETQIAWFFGVAELL